MPSHIYVLLGMYHDAAEANIEAIIKDDIFVVKEGLVNYYTGYRIHNMHFVAYAAMFAGTRLTAWYLHPAGSVIAASPIFYILFYVSVDTGRFEAAMEAAETIKRNLPADVLRNSVLATYFESFVSINLHVLVRFGKWEELLNLAIPTDTEVCDMCR